MSGDPDAAELGAVRGLLAAGDVAAARLQLQQFPPSADPERDYLQALCDAVEGNYAAAAGQLASLWHRGPARLDVLIDYLQCVERLGTPARALAALDGLHPERLRVPPAALCGLAARLALQAGAAELALPWARRWTQVQPAEPEAWRSLAGAQRQRGELAGAIRSLHRLIELEGPTALNQVALGEALAALGDSEPALATLRAAVVAYPDHPQAHATLADVLLGVGEAQAALPAARRATELAAQDPRCWTTLSLALRLGGALQAAAEAALQATRLQFAPGPLPHPAPQALRETSIAKLRHDIEQYRHLQAIGVLDGAAAHADALELLLQRLPADQHPALCVPLPDDLPATLRHTYNRLQFHQPPAALPGGALNPALRGADIEAAYHARAPGVTWVDQLLRPEALQALRQYLLESTFWFDFRHAGGYLGAMFDQGLVAPLLLQIAEELRALLPGVLGGMPLTQMWAFKYDSELEGIDLHADVAAVNVNFWITPDEANLDPERGGLVLWDQRAPADWNFADFNTAGRAGQERIQTFLQRSGAQAVRVPHRCNRAVLFHSDLFHRTDSVRFAPGYAQRRINITLLYGLRGAVAIRA